MLSLDHLSSSSVRERTSPRGRVRKRQRHKHNRHRHNKRRRDKKKKESVSNNNNDICAVCLNDSHMDCRLSPCNHVFHSECISQWVTRNFSCPLCRQEIRQFIPLGRRRNKVMREFEQLWVQHYILKDTNPDTDTSDSNTLQNQKKSTSDQDSFEVDLGFDVKKEKILSETQIEGDISVESPIVSSDSCTDTDSSQEITHSLWSRVWNDILLINQSRVDKGTSHPKSITTMALNSITNDEYNPNTNVTSPTKNKDNIDKNEGLKFDTCAKSPSHFNFKKSQNENTNRHLRIFEFEEEEADQYEYEYEQEIEEELEELPYVKEKERVRNINDYKSVRDHTWLNARAGLVAGMAATIGTCGATALSNINRRILIRAFAPVAMETVPTVCAFFTTYEHLKHYFFESDSNNNNKSISHSRVFGERFISAGIAGTVASATVGAKSPILGLRFAAFFGGFEMFKDIRLLQNINRENRQLNVCEVATAATLGGFAASTIYYPLTQVIKQISFGNMAQTQIDSSLSGVLSGRMGMSVALNPSMLYRGFVRHTSTFLPSCVACSCAFEFARRSFESRDRD